VVRCEAGELRLDDYESGTVIETWRFGRLFDDPVLVLSTFLRKDGFEVLLSRYDLRSAFREPVVKVLRRGRRGGVRAHERFYKRLVAGEL